MARGTMAVRLSAAVAVAAAAAVALTTPVASQDATDYTRYLNCGSDLIKSWDGHTWDLDRAFSAGIPFVRTGLAATALPALFHTNRFQPGRLSYTLTVPEPSLYRVEMAWAEIFFNETGRRFMDVFITVDGAQTVVVVQGLDVVDAAAGANVPYKLVYPPLSSSTYGMPIDRTVQVTVQVSGTLPPTADVANVANEAFLSGVGVYQNAPPPPAPEPEPEAPLPVVFPEPDPSAISAAFEATNAAGAPTLPLRVTAAAALAEAKEAADKADDDRKAVASVYGVSTKSPEVTTAYENALAAVQAVVTSKDSLETLYGTSFGPLMEAYDASIGFIKSLSPPVCSFLTGFETPFGFTDEKALATNVAAVEQAAATASAAAQAVADARAAVAANVESARSALDTFYAVVQNEATASPLPEMAA